MLFARRVNEHRPVLVFAVLVALSLFSLATGTRASLVHNGVRTVVSVVAYPFLKTLNRVEKGTDYVTGLVVRYQAAHEEVEMLRHMLGRTMLRTADREELLDENKRLRRMIEFERTNPRLSLQPVEVLERFEGMLVVDRGSAHGMKPSMCAIAPDGVVGLVTKVDLLTSNVATLHHADCRIGAMVRRNRVRGNVIGSGKDVDPSPTMQFIDAMDDVHEGDEVVTSPESIFPGGIPLGRVTAVHADGSLWKNAEIQPACLPDQVDEVFILVNAEAAPEELAGFEPEEAAPVTPGMLLDTASIQDYYAP